MGRKGISFGIMSSSNLNHAQLHALFDVLNHYETYSEVENFKWPDAISKFGKPFPKDAEQPSKSPLLQIMMSKFVLPIPGLSSVDDDFWTVKVKTTVENFGNNELSESYDKGAIGLRKTFATAAAAVLESPAKGAIGGFPAADVDPNQKYDTSNPDDVLKAWGDFLQRLVYGDMIDELFTKSAESDKLEDHLPVVQAAHEYILVNLATIVHHVLIVSPEGQALLRLLTNVHKLLPYTLARQTLKVGNAATMINGMVKLMLAKLSIGSITNWLGISKGAGEGMNLMQHIISTVLGWDSSDIRKRATAIENAKDGPSKEYLAAIDSHIQSSRDSHDKTRENSRTESKSIVSVIFEENALSPDIPLEKHAKAQEYYAARLSVRDRDQIVQTLCRQDPDYFTDAVREAVAAYEPIIRALHNAADLSGGLSDVERFLTDLIKLSKLPPKDSDEKPPSIEDYVDLLRGHQHGLHRFLHQIAKNGTQVSEIYRNYSLKAIAEFRVAEKSNGGAGALTPILQSIFEELSEDERNQVTDALKLYSEYLSTLENTSVERLKSILARKRESTPGPGMYMAKWEALIDSTTITPATPSGPVRFGGDQDVSEASRVDLDGNVESTKVPLPDSEGLPKMPRVDVIVRLLGNKYRDALARLGK